MEADGTGDERGSWGQDQAGTGRIYDAKIPLPYLELKCCGMSLAATFYARRSTFCVLRCLFYGCPLPVEASFARPSVRTSVRLTDRPSNGCQFHFAQHFSSCCLCEKFWQSQQNKQRQPPPGRAGYAAGSTWHVVYTLQALLRVYYSSLWCAFHVLLSVWTLWSQQIEEVATPKLACRL